MMKKIVFIGFIVNIVLVKGQSVDPLETTNKAAQTKWVDSILKNMTVEQKIGQLFMAQAYSNKNEKHAVSIDSLIELH